MSTAQPFRLEGLIAATFTPMKQDHSVDLDRVPALVEQVLGQGVNGLFLCGSTGEGASLTLDERRSLTEAFVAATDQRVPVIVHVGHNCLDDARALAAHAEQAGADAIAAAPPSYFRPADVATLIDCLEVIAAGASGVPFYYYHIPRLTGVEPRMIDLLEQLGDRIPTFTGIKFSEFLMDDLLECVRHEEGRFNILFGSDEMLLAGLASGAEGAVGSTYNFAGRLYRQVLDHFARGDLEAARESQALAVNLVRVILRHAQGGAQPALKATMNLLGVDCGPPRLPLRALSSSAQAGLKAELDALHLP